MHFYYNPRVLVASNGKRNGTNKAKQYSDTFRPNHGTKRASICTKCPCTKKLFYTKVWKKIIHLWQTVALQRQYRQQCIVLERFLKGLKAFGGGVCTLFDKYINFVSFSWSKLSVFSFSPHTLIIYSLFHSHTHLHTTRHRNTLSVK